MDNMNICDMCGFVAKTQKKITQHKKTHDTGDFSCDTCPKKFTRLQSLREHVSKVHSTNKFSCTICDKGFSVKGDVDKHVATVHKNKKPLKCEICEKTYSQKRKISTRRLGRWSKKINVISIL